LRTRKIISVFLFIVLSAQLLPLQQTVRWLLSGQTTEELSHLSDPDPGPFGNDLQRTFLPVYSPALHDLVQLREAVAIPARAEALSGRHADDIPTPPPNC
jgi:hypothetical protein